MYEDNLSTALEKALMDEISASIAYKALSEITKDEKITKAMVDHAAEEFAHYNAILSFCLNHGIKVNTYVDNNVANNYPTDEGLILPFIQRLETQAISDYKGIALLARSVGDLETEMFFISLMKDEMNHFDELAALNNGTRPLNQ